MTQINIDLPETALLAVQKIAETKGANATPIQLVNLKRLQSYIRIMKNGPGPTRGRPRIPMHELIRRHMNRIAPDGEWIRRTALRQSVGSYRAADEFNDALDTMVRDGTVLQRNDQICLVGGE